MDTQCIIIGGGMSGLMAANILENKGFKTIILDKGRGIGGRLATRRIKNETFGEGVFDYGAQFFTVNHPLFRDWVNRWQARHIIEKWSDGFILDKTKARKTGTLFYRGRNSNRDIAKHLSANLNVHTSMRVTSFVRESNQWHVNTEKSESFSGDLLVLTAPIPQILELFDNSGIVPDEQTTNRLINVTSHRCIAGLILLKNKSNIPAPGGVWMDGEPISWIADNTVKGISPNGNAITIHTGPEFSMQSWDWENDKILNTMLQSCGSWIGQDIADYQIHRWKYSQPFQTFGEPFLYISQPGPMILAGDGFTGNRIESAALSGINAAEFISSELLK